LDYYKTNVKKYETHGLYIPIIFIVDNDEGAEEIKKLFKIVKKYLSPMIKRRIMRKIMENTFSLEM